MNTLAMVSALTGCAVAQALLPSWHALGSAKPPVLLAAVLYYALVRPRNLAVAAAIMGGLLQDALDHIPLGFSSWVFLLVALPVTRNQSKIFGHHGFTHMAIGAIAAGATTLALYLLLVARGAVERSFPSALAMALGALVLGLLTTPLAFRILQRMDRKLGNLPERGW